MSHDGRRHVRMGLNPTRDDDLAAGVEDVPDTFGQRSRFGNRHNLLTAHTNVPLPHTTRGDDLAASDDVI
jgi:hypothetical protein